MSCVSVFILSAVMLMGFVYFYTSTYIAQRTDETINAALNGLKDRYQDSGMGGLQQVISKRVASDSIGSDILLLADYGKNTLAGNLDQWPDVKGTPDGWINFRLEGRGHGDDIPHWARARWFTLPEGFQLIVGRDLYDLEMSRNAIARTLSWGLVAAGIMAILGGVTLARGFLRRIEMINQASNEIINGDLSRRIRTDNTGDDFDQLSNNLNQMLDRIVELMEGVRRVSDNIAHDLRTPLARLRNHLDELKSASGSEGDTDSVDQAIQEADELLATFNALLRIARLESESQPDYLVDVDLVAVVSDAVEFYEPLAEEKMQRMEMSVPPDSLIILGDRGLLSQLIANLLDNAIKYAPAQGHIKVSLLPGPEYVTLAIADSGAGIPIKERSKVFQRFYRLESSRSSPGNGLGLSLVAAVAALHAAPIRLSDNQPGLRVIIDFPRQHV